MLHILNTESIMQAKITEIRGIPIPFFQQKKSQMQSFVHNGIMWYEMHNEIF